MLKGIRLSQIAKFCDGKLIAAGKDDPVIAQLSTDSRSLKGGELFAAIKGEKFDGHLYLKDVAKKGAVAVISQEEVKLDIPVIVVDDTVKALAKIGSSIRSRIKSKVCAVTGSAGKSSTKDAISVLLGGSTVKSPASFNNLIGVSQTMWLVSDETPYLVLEMGMNAPGEIKELCETFSPQFGMITNVGNAHIGKLGGVDGIYRAKKEMFDFLARYKDTKGIALNLDDAKVRDAYSASFGKKTPATVTYSCSDSKADVYVGYKAIDPESGKLHLEGHIKKQKFSLDLPVFGLHHAQNVAAAMAAASLMGISSEDILARAPGIRPAYHRGEIVELPGDKVLIDESYNSNPTALISSLTTLAELNPARRRVLILGEMRELGDFGEALHREVGDALVKLHEEKKYPFTLIGVGGMTRFTIETLKSKLPHIPWFHVESHKEALQKLQELVKPKDIIFIKGSRGIELDQIVKSLTK
jgi:UDP-N-acetylmuramoyl-tripeptide--D-alanyl-D-alanine ligase